MPPLDADSGKEKSRCPKEQRPLKWIRFALLATTLGSPSGRIVEKPLISEKPDGGEQPDRREPAGKGWLWWARER